MPKILQTSSGPVVGGDANVCETMYVDRSCQWEIIIKWKAKHRIVRIACFSYSY